MQIIDLSHHPLATTKLTSVPHGGGMLHFVNWSKQSISSQEASKALNQAASCLVRLG